MNYNLLPSFLSGAKQTNPKTKKIFTMEIKDIYGKVLYSDDTCTTIKELVEKAVFNKINLIDADLESANLICANLESANLESANLESANLRSANLRSAKKIPYIPLACPSEGP